jgi:membrane protein implicated in regulation of membrane protease activity
MEGLAAAVVAIAILLGALLLVAFIVFCLVKINTADEVRFLPRWAWSVLVVCVSPLGGVVYLLSQRLRTHSPRRA